MAFTGTATIKQVSDGIVRITGLSLGAGASGTVGLFGNVVAPGVRLPESFKPAPYGSPFGTVTLADALDLVAQVAAIGNAENFMPAIVKSGTDDTDFIFTVTNTAASESAALEFYVRFHE